MLGLFCPAVIHLVTFWEYGDDENVENSNSNDNTNINHYANMYTGFDNTDPEYDAASNVQNQYRTTVQNIDRSTITKKSMSWFIIVKDAFIVLLALAALVSGTYASMMDIIASYGSDSETAPVNTTTATSIVPSI